MITSEAPDRTSGTIEPNAGGAERQAGDFVAAAFLWLLWALSVLPLVVLFLEFDDGSPVCVGASYYAKLYGHIFVYPATFGLLATAFLTRPWLHTVRSLRAWPPPKRGRVVAFLACAIVGIVTFASWGDFTGETEALWSFEAAAKHEIEDATILKACKILKERSEERTTDEEQNEANPQPRQTLDALQSDRDIDDTRSYTEWAYYVFFIANTTWIALLFGVVVVRAAVDDPSQLGETIVAMGLATAWVAFRGAYLVEKVELYNDPLLSLDYLILMGFVVLYLHILRLYAGKLDDKKRIIVSIGQVIAWILTCSAALVGPLVGLGWLGDSGTELLVRYFGSKSSLLVYITMLLLFLVMVAPAAVRRLWGDPEPQASGENSGNPGQGPDEPSRRGPA